MLFWWICKIIWRGLLVCWAFGEMSLRWLKLIVCFRRLVVLWQSNSFLQSRQKDIPRQDYTKKSVEISGISYKGKRNLVKAEGMGMVWNLPKSFPNPRYGRRRWKPTRDIELKSLLSIQKIRMSDYTSIWNKSINLYIGSMSQKKLHIFRRVFYTWRSELGKSFQLIKERIQNGFEFCFICFAQSWVLWIAVSYPPFRPQIPNHPMKILPEHKYMQ